MFIFYYLRHGNVDDTQAIERTSTSRKSLCVCERAVRASLVNFRVCTFQKSSFFYYFCWYFGYFVGIITFVLVTFVASVHSMQFPFHYSWHGTRNARLTSYQQNKISVRANRASELGKFRIHVRSKSPISFAIFVGT